MHDDLITVAQASELLGVSVCRVRQLIHLGSLRARMVGRDWLVRRSDVAARAESPRRSGRPKKMDPRATKKATKTPKTPPKTTLYGTHENP